VTELTLRLALLFLPGIICALLVEKLVPTSAWSTARLALYALVLGLACYLIYAVVETVFAGQWPPSVDILGSLANNEPLDFSEILLATALAPIVALGVSFALNKHWINRLAKTLDVSNRFGDIDVWARTFNSRVLQDAWVVVRDFDRDLALEGWVNAFAETHDVNELLLRDVRIYQSSTSKFLYEVDSMYLTRPKDKLTIEFRRGGA
jgi:hypothetical protein